MIIKIKTNLDDILKFILFGDIDSASLQLYHLLSNNKLLAYRSMLDAKRTVRQPSSVAQYI